MNPRSLAIVLIAVFTGVTNAFAQNVQVKGFVDVTSAFSRKQLSFGFDEEDLFINAVINNKISFLGESVIKFDPSSTTEFGVSIERIIINYNIKGNNNLIFGKIHTPVNYWNDTYHHGRVFFPTIDRPLLFAANIIPLHTVGAGVQGHDLGKLKFGYNFFVGNGLGSDDVLDNDKHKSLTAAINIKPADRLKIGMSYYHDVISKGSVVYNKTINWKVNQDLLSLSVSRFGKKFEVLAEGTTGLNHTDTTGTKATLASYIYAGYKIKDKIIPYLRYDNISYQAGEIYYTKNNMSSVVAGLRYEINYLAVIKLEYQYQHNEIGDRVNKVSAQFAIGF
jgi:hypothetical protein